MKSALPFRDLLLHVNANWQPLNDKPEETPESTLRALWFLAAGEWRAVERCGDIALPSLSKDQLDRLDNLIRQRLSGVPLAHLTGRQTFMGIEMLAGPEALIPRKETELLGRAALETLRRVVSTQSSARIIDLCTGCGNLALALAHYEPHCRVFAADLSPDAIDLANRNAQYLRLDHRVEFHVGDLFAPFEDSRFLERMDLVVCNPPYIATQHIAEMPEEIQAYEPHLAFDGGPFGVSLVLRLIKEAPRFLKPKGWLCFEVGKGQGPLLTRKVRRDGRYARVTALPDANGDTRAILAQQV